MEAVVNHIKCAKDAAALAWLLDSTVCNPAEEASRFVTRLRRFCAGKRGQLDTPELVERLWRLLNTELSADCRLRCLALPASTTCCTAGTGPSAPRCRRTSWCSTCAKAAQKIAQRAPTPTPAPADTDDDNANFGLTGAGVGLGSSGDEADVDDDLDIGWRMTTTAIDEADFVWPPRLQLPGCRLPLHPPAPAVAAAAAAATPALDEEMLDDGDRDAAEDDEDEDIRLQLGQTCLTAELLTRSIYWCAVAVLLV
uniref:Transcription initiation factor TFIID subunit 2 TPR repeats domain-containing protein n=1 Tax=Macrostomum lignano TaxID=282301 RepID=A0A1I8FLZ9_9PLAT